MTAFVSLVRRYVSVISTVGRQQCIKNINKCANDGGAPLLGVSDQRETELDLATLTLFCRARARASNVWETSEYYRRVYSR